MGNEIVFARTRYDYDSYTDYWKLVELSGFPVVYIDEIDTTVPRVTYIASPFNGEFFTLNEQERAPGTKISLWNLERPGGSGGIEDYKQGNLKNIEEGYVDEIIVSDHALADLTKYKYVPMGSHPDLGEPWATKQYGFVHLMCYSNRRGILFDTPSEPKITYSGCRIAPNGWGEERHKSLQKSWYMLNVHQDEYQYMEPLRFSLAAAYALPILSENLTADPFPYQHGVIQFPMNQLDQAMMSAMRGRHELSEIGMKMRNFVMTHHTFKTCVERSML